MTLQHACEPRVSLADFVHTLAHLSGLRIIGVFVCQVCVCVCVCVDVCACVSVCLCACVPVREPTSVRQGVQAIAP